MRSFLFALIAALCTGSSTAFLRLAAYRLPVERRGRSETVRSLFGGGGEQPGTPGGAMGGGAPAGGQGGGNPLDMMQKLKQAQEISMKIKTEMAEHTILVSSTNGLVSIEGTGTGTVKGVKLADAAMQVPKEELEALIREAIEIFKVKYEEYARNKQMEVMRAFGGMPGMGGM